MANEKPTKDRRFRSVMEVRQTYLPALVKSQSAEHMEELVEKTTEVIEHALRRRVKK